MTQPGTPGGAKATDPSNPDPTKTQGQQGDKDAELRQKTAALAEEREKTRAMKEELETLRAAAAGRGPAAPAAPGFPGAPAPDPNAHLRQLDELWERDPRQAMQTELSMALRWYDQASVQLDIQADETAKKFADFNSYRTDVLRYIRTLPMESRNRQGVVEAAYYMVKGQKADDLVTLSKEELIAKIRAGEKVQGLEGAMPGGAPQKVQPGAPTADQMKAAQAMGMTIEEYMKHSR